MCPCKATSSHPQVAAGPAASVWVAFKQRASSVLFAMVWLWFRYGLWGFCRVPASPFPRCIPHSAHHSPPYYRDAAAPEKVTALWRRKCCLRAAQGLPGNLFPPRAQTSRMKILEYCGGPAQGRRRKAKQMAFASNRTPGLRSHRRFNAEAQRFAESRKDFLVSAFLHESLRLCVGTGLALVLLTLGLAIPCPAAGLYVHKPGWVETMVAAAGRSGGSGVVGGGADEGCGAGLVAGEGRFPGAVGLGVAGRRRRFREVVSNG